MVSRPNAGLPPDPRGPWPLPGSVKPYRRHALACTGTDAWPVRLEDEPGFAGRLARDVYGLRESAPLPPKLTATDEPSRGAGIDLLVFPEAVRYLGVDEESWPDILGGHLVSGEIQTAYRHEALPGVHVFVCVHAARDERCGACGPAVRQALVDECATRGLRGVSVRSTSHVGGHKYAGNVLVYPDGVWYGYVRPGDVPRIVREHLQEGRVVEELLRGRMEAPCRLP